MCFVSGSCCPPLSQGHVSWVPHSFLGPSELNSSVVSFPSFEQIIVIYIHTPKFTFSPFLHLIKRSNNSIFVLIYVSLSANPFRSKVYVALHWKPAQEATFSDVRGWMLYFTTQARQVIEPARVVAMHSCFLSAVSCTPICISSDSANVEKDRLQADPLVKGWCWCLDIWLVSVYLFCRVGHTGHCKIYYTDE